MVLSYNYRARDGAGKSVEGTIEGESERQAVEKLRARGFLVTSLEVSRDISLKTISAIGRRNAARPGKVPLKALAVFCKQFATMVGAGVPILSALKILADQTENRRLGAALKKVGEEIEAGETLTNAFRKQGATFPLILTNMIAAGEVGGILEDVFERMGEHFEKENAVTQKVRSAMTYPTVISIIAALVVVFLVGWVLPNFVALFQSSGVALPTPTLILLGASHILRTYWYAIFGGAALALVAFRRWVATERGAYRVDALSLKAPVFGSLVLRRSLSRFCRTLSTLLKSGVPVMVAMSVVEKTVGNRVVAGVVRRAQVSLRDGMSMTGPLRQSGVFPAMVIEMMVVGEETGATDTMLQKVADFYDKEIDSAVERMTAMLEPLIIVVLGGVVAFILVSMIMPMFDVFQMVK
ncbi:MAG TPA: type II secretion system F family protein [Bacillota bacterium]